MSERMRMWMGRRSDSLAPDLMTDAEVLAEMPTETLLVEARRRLRLIDDQDAQLAAEMIGYFVEADE